MANLTVWFLREATMKQRGDEPTNKILDCTAGFLSSLINYEFFQGGKQPQNVP
jgi:hypothetical protein